MNPPKLLEDTSTIVLVGSFNPAIFQPAWFAAKGLLRESESVGAENLLIAPEVSNFRADWLHVTVTRQRFQAQSGDSAHHVLLKDLVSGTFQLLEHTPLTVMGIHRAFHWQLGDTLAWHAFGDWLMPKDPWAGLLEKPGLRSLLVQAERSDALPGRRFVTVEPSQKHPTSAYIRVTDDILLPPESDKDGAGYFIEILRDQWQRLQAEELTLATELLRRCGGAKS